MKLLLLAAFAAAWLLLVKLGRALAKADEQRVSEARIAEAYRRVLAVPEDASAKSELIEAIFAPQSRGTTL